MAPRRLVLFDVDGTLLWPDGAGRASLKRALEQVFGTAGEIDAYHFAGHTDRETVFNLMAGAGFAPDEIERRFDRLAPAMQATLAGIVEARTHHIQPCPGGPALVARLAGLPGVTLGLLTGNLRPTAEIKLRAAGYDPALFRVGAFGDLSARRADLPPRALEDAFRVTGLRFAGGQVVIVGDTPADVTCGQGVGARSIAVLTGWTERPDIEAAGPHYLFDDLSVTEDVLRAILAPVAEDQAVP